MWVLVGRWETVVGIELPRDFALLADDYYSYIVGCEPLHLFGL